MQRINPGFWAKKEEKNAHFAWLPLAQHLEDTKKISGLLWEHWLSESQRKQITESLEGTGEESAKNLVQFLGAVHDIGKATPAFQHACGIQMSPDLDAVLWERLEREGFSDFSSLNLISAKYSHHSIAGQRLLSSFGVKEDIASIVGGHHGRPIDNMELCDNQKSFSKNYFQNENSKDPIHQKWEREQRAVFEWALETSGFSQVGDLPEVKQPAQVILSGLLIMADWIASNTAYFPLMPIDCLAIENQHKRLSDAWGKWSVRQNWDPHSSYNVLNLYSRVEDLYRKRFGFEHPRNMQKEFAEIIKQTKNPGIFILEAPMGEGKTEAALAAAEILAWKTGASGIFFGLPTQATSNGVFPRIEQWLEQLSCDDPELENSYRPRLVHGKSALNQSVNLPPAEEMAENIDVDGSNDGSVLINEWFSGRKTANLDDFVVGTIDQFLMLALKQKHLALRHLGFSKKVVIIDEVHAYDAYMSQYLYRAVTWMAAYGVPVIILSATLPADKRQELALSYLKGAGWDQEIQREQGLKTDAYPLITYTDGKQIVQFDAFEQNSGKEVEISRLQEEDLQQLIENLYARGGVIGIIVNTVRRAQELARKCIEQVGHEGVELLHSRFISTDRIAKEKELLRMIGKGADRPEKKIIIGTQVIEQSLDIDFDVLVTDLAPMDLLIQRAGRLHRHTETKRPDYHKKPVLYVLGSDRELNFEEGAKSVYGSYLLARTQYFLPEKISLPEDISRLVQKVYTEDISVSFEGELQSKYEEMKKDHIALLHSKKKKANTYRINKPAYMKRRKGNSLIGWLSNTHPNESEERAYAQVRDSTETIEVIALKKIGSGYGVFGSNVDISGRINEPELAKDLARHTVPLPQVLSASYRVDHTIQALEQYNYETLQSWQEQPWLKGTLGIIFDHANQFTLNGYSLFYDLEYGLSYEGVRDGNI